MYHYAYNPTALPGFPCCASSTTERTTGLSSYLWHQNLLPIFTRGSKQVHCQPSILPAWPTSRTFCPSQTRYCGPPKIWKINRCWAPDTSSYIPSEHECTLHIFLPTLVARKICDTYGCLRLSIGEAIRRVLSKFPHSELAQQLQSYLQSGQTVPEELCVLALDSALLDVQCTTRG